MEIIAFLLVCALAFGLCFLVDKGFTRVFRNRRQQKSGLSVHLAKGYALAGLLITVLGIALFAALFDGKDPQNWRIILLSAVMVLFGAGLLTVYLSYGIYYDADTFLLCTFGKKPAEYRYDKIRYQRIYNIRGMICVALTMQDGREVALYANMQGLNPFLDTAFLGYCRQRGLDPEQADFYDPNESKWFPMEQEEG